jgi:hypothetical protein
VELGGVGHVGAGSLGRKRLGDACPGFVVSAGARVGVGRDALIERVEAGGADRVGFAQTAFDAVEASRRVLL